MSDRAESESTVPVRRITPEQASDREDRVAVEEPMEIRVVFGPADKRTARSLSVTMRTPGNDFDLAAGFLFTEAIITDPGQIRKIEFCGSPAPNRPTSNIVRVDLENDLDVDLGRLQRHFFTTSSCGICGKASLEALHVQGIAPLRPTRPRVPRERIHDMPGALRSGQPLFESTGGLHAAGLMGPDGSPSEVREDVGRHNAVDKLLGRRFLDGKTPLIDEAMVISGRASFEILQKALVAGVAMIVAVGAPSSLAVEMAERFGMTLIGFASRERFNVYTGHQRIVEE